MTESTQIVHVVDDDASFARALSRQLRGHGFKVQTFGSATEFLAHVPPEARGCVVLDLAMPELDGLAAQEAMARAGHALPIVFLTGHGDVPSTVSAMRGGAEDVLTKVAPEEALLAAIRRALARDANETVRRVRMRALHHRFAALTPREVQVLHLVLQGRLNKQIAWELGIHERTVKLHRTSLTAKIGVSSVAELAQLAHEADWHQDEAG